FEYITAEDIAELEQIVAEEAAANYNKNMFSLDKEIAFHGKLYQISRNRTLQRFQDLLLPVFEYHYQQERSKNNVDYQYSSCKFVNHKMLLDHLKTGTPDTFRNAMRRHLEPHFDKIFLKKR